MQKPFSIPPSIETYSKRFI